MFRRLMSLFAVLMLLCAGLLGGAQAAVATVTLVAQADADCRADVLQILTIGLGLLFACFVLSLLQLFIAKLLSILRLAGEFFLLGFLLSTIIATATDDAHRRNQNRRHQHGDETLLHCVHDVLRTFRCC